ncbi:MAG: HemK2/MTQ2 family protein methyltransferase [Candidatus Sifarchaeia archaeon]
MDNEGYDITVFPGVYPPSEDTYLLLDSLEIRSDDAFLEIGCGAGLITMVAAMKTHDVVSIDSSLEAVRNTIQNLKTKDLHKNCQVIESDLLSALAPSSKFSLIVFNPPYLPQDDEHTNLDHALIGGRRGSELTQRFIRQAAEHLTAGGRVFLVVSTIGDIDSIRKTMTECGFEIEIVAEAPLFFEKIQVLKGRL